MGVVAVTTVRIKYISLHVASIGTLPKGQQMHQYILHRLLVLILTLSLTVGFAYSSPLEDSSATPSAEGEWVLKPLKDGSVLSLEYEYHILLPNDVANSASFGFVCDRRKSGKISAALFPFEGTYNNQQDEIPVLIERSSNASDSSSLFQKWGNGYKYIFLNPTAEVKKLVDYLKSRQAEGSESVDVLFSGDFYGKSETLLKISVGLSKFPVAFSRFELACGMPMN